MTFALVTYGRARRTKKLASYFFAGLLLDAMFLALLVMAGIP